MNILDDSRFLPLTLDSGESPEVRFWDLEEPPEGRAVEFRLMYRGPLASDGNFRQKHAVRKSLHPQIKQYWKDNPVLRNYLVPEGFTGEQCAIPVMQIADQYKCGTHRFVPLARKDWKVSCALDILFMRRGFPGNITNNGGDLDNRLKTLLDGLRVPDLKDTACLPAESEEGFDPVFCLMEDDAQITSLKVTTDRMLWSPEPEDRERHVLLIIHVHLYMGTHPANLVGLPGNL